MSKPRPVVVHTSNEDLFFAMLNAQTDARIARDDAKCARGQRDAAFEELRKIRLSVALENRKRIRRNKQIAKFAFLGLCGVSSVLSAIICIHNGLWWTIIAPLLTVAYSVFDLWHGLR